MVEKLNQNYNIAVNTLALKLVHNVVECKNWKDENDKTIMKYE